MTFSGSPEGLPNLTGETPGRIWHTGDAQTDPWCWKDRAAKEKKLAFGCILGGHKGFIAPWMYPSFLAACRPEGSMEERRCDGLVSQAAWELWKLFKGSRELDTGEIRRKLGVSKKKGCSRADSAVSELQQYFYITVTGSRQRIGRDGQPYGWHINTYEKVDDWAPAEWFAGRPAMRREDAIETILDRAAEICENIDTDKLARILFR